MKLPKWSPKDGRKPRSTRNRHEMWRMVIGREGYDINGSFTGADMLFFMDKAYVCGVRTKAGVEASSAEIGKS